MQFNANDILFLLVLFLLLFISVFLLTSLNGKRISNVLIGAFFLAIALNLADSFLLLKQVYLRYPHYALWGSNLLLICGPLLFFYVQSVLYKDFAFTRVKWLHFIPFIFIFLIAEISYLYAGTAQQLKILNAITERRIPATVYLASSFIYIHFFLYLLAALRLVKRYRVAAVNQYSNAQRATLTWLWQTMLFFFVLILISTANSFLSFLSLKQSYFMILSITIFLLLVFVIYVLFKALRNPGIFSVWEQKQVEEALNTKYASSTLTGADKELLLKKLQDHMLRNKPYLEPELTLDELANQLSVKPKSLSQVINELLEQNFFEFINHYRIEEAKRLLTAPADKKITVLEVLYEVGFNSKSSFNTLFKKQTGITPSEFKKKNMG